MSYTVTWGVDQIQGSVVKVVERAERSNVQRLWSVEIDFYDLPTSIGVSVANYRVVIETHCMSLSLIPPRPELPPPLPKCAIAPGPRINDVDEGKLATSPLC